MIHPRNVTAIIARRRRDVSGARAGLTSRKLYLLNISAGALVISVSRRSARPFREVKQPAFAPRTMVQNMGRIADLKNSAVINSARRCGRKANGRISVFR